MNDITEPVVEPVYDNVDIVTETVHSPKKSDEKLQEMVKDLQKPLDSLTSDIQVPETLLKVDEAKPVTTDQKPPNPEKSASVIKIDDPFLPSQEPVSLEPSKLTGLIPEDKKPEDTKPDGTKPQDTKPEDKKPEDTKPQDTKPQAKNSTTVKKLDESNPLFSNLYPSLTKSDTTTVEKVDERETNRTRNN